MASLTLSFGLPTSSNLNQGMTPRSQKLAAVSPLQGSIAENIQVFPSEGFTASPTVPAATGASNVDLYRYGGNQVNAAGQTVSVGNIPALKVDDFADQPASIRLWGTGSSFTTPRDLVPPFTKFILENVREGTQERSQIVETFGDFYVFFFGTRPAVYSFSGTLINTKNANWLEDFLFYYENYLSGTKAVENNAQLVLTYGGRQIEGFILNLNTNTAAATEKGVQFSFDVVVTDRKTIGVSDDFGMVLQNNQIGQDTQFLSNLTSLGIADKNVSDAYQMVKKVLSAQQSAASINPAKAVDLPSLQNSWGLNNLIPLPSGGVSLA